MKTYKTSCTQSRVATGRDQSATTTVIVTAFAHAPNSWVPYAWAVGWGRNPGYTPGNGFLPVATVEITHPAIMAGTREDVAADFSLIALNMLRDDGSLELDARGQEFFSDAAIATAKNP